MHPVPAHATGEIVGDVLEATGPGPTLAVLFVTHPLTGTIDDVVGAVQQMLRPTHLLAITTGGVLGAGSEVEDGSALSLWAVSGGSVETFLLPAQQCGVNENDHRALACSETASGLVLLADADSFGVNAWLAAQNPRLAVAGASFGVPAQSRSGRLKLLPPSEANADSPDHVRAPQGFGNRPNNTNVLFRNGEKAAGGALAMAFGPEFAFRSLVSQSCRPVGKPFTVTKAERTVLYAMGGRSASASLDLVVEQCDEVERTLLRQGVHLGVVVNGGLGLSKELPRDVNSSAGHLREDQFGVAGSGAIEEFGLGDFVVHQVLGADRNAGAIALSGTCEVGDVVQFHAKDAEAARLECQARLAEAMATNRTFSPNSYGALLFASAFRGTALFGSEHHDASAVGEYPAVASAGAFCRTQLGPIGHRQGQHESALTVALLCAAD
jgi:small ligand-binding sensory domain FIST